MSKIIVSLDGKILKEVELSKERTHIGRRPHNDVVIDNLAVSGEHAVIVTTGSDSVIEDLNSTTGTLVNGQPVKKHFLQNNDLIELAKYRIKFIAEARRPAFAIDDDAATMQPHRDGAPRYPHATTLPLETREGMLEVVNGANAGKQLKLVKALTTLGRPGVQVAVITRRPEGYFLTHVEGANFPLVRGQPIGTEVRMLKQSDVIELSGTKMTFTLA